MTNDQQIEASVRATAEIMLFINDRRPIMGDEATEEIIRRTLHSTSEFISQKVPQLEGRGNHRTKSWSEVGRENFKVVVENFLKNDTKKRRKTNPYDEARVIAEECAKKQMGFHNEHQMPIDVTQEMIASGELDTVEKLTVHLLKYARQFIISNSEDSKLNQNGSKTGKSILECQDRYQKFGIKPVEFDAIEYVMSLREKSNKKLISF